MAANRTLRVENYATATVTHFLAYRRSIIQQLVSSFSL